MGLEHTPTTSKKYDLNNAQTWCRNPYTDKEVFGHSKWSPRPSTEIVDQVGPLNVSACLTIQNLKRLVSLHDASLPSGDVKFLYNAVNFIADNMVQMGIAAPEEVLRITYRLR